MRLPSFPAFGLIALLCAHAQAAAPPQAWVERSNLVALEVLRMDGEFFPEFISRTGLPGFDERVTDLTATARTRLRQAGEAMHARLMARRATEADPQVRRDLEIMIQRGVRGREEDDLKDRLLLPFHDVAAIVLGGVGGLLAEQVPPERQRAALPRLQCYVGLRRGCTAMTELAKARTEERLGHPTLIGPDKAGVERVLANSARFAADVRQLFAKHRVEGADPALDRLAAQLDDYAAWTRRVVLPRARLNPRQPPELYALALKDAGVDIAPEALIRMALVEFAQIRNTMQTLVPAVAAAEGLAVTDYRQAIRQLKRKQLDPSSTAAWYREVIAKLETTVRRERIVTLPDRPMNIRMATEAESAAIPAPHYLNPRLVDNRGERGVFVVPRGKPSTTASGGDGIDDFTALDATWTLAAHEGRPGHDLQFSAMVERGVSLARSLFAYNSANVEGWALYAEAEVLPYLPPAAQLFSLQHRLMRAARAFLDPMLNLGLATPEQAREILLNDVVLSPALVRQEVDRYTSSNPAQATGYLYGYLRLIELRTETRLALGTRFDRLAFNDFVIGQGLLTPDLLASAVREEFVPVQRAGGPRG